MASGSATPADQGKLTIISELEKLTTSTKTVADYFKEKLQLKSSQSSSAASTPADSETPESSTPASGLGMTRRADYDEERPAGGLGFGGGGLGFGGGGLGFSKVRLEVKGECNVVEEATMRMGLSKFSSLMSSRFLTSETLGFDEESSTPDFSESRSEPVAEEESSSSPSEEESREERKRRRKAEKEKKKAEDEREKKREKKEKKWKEQKRVEKKERKEKRSKKTKDA